MNALLAANWTLLIAFAAGIGLGMVAGWLLRHWRDDDDAPAEIEPRRRSTVHPQPQPEVGRVTHIATARVERAPARRRAESWEDEEGVGPGILLVDDRLEMLGIHAAYLRKHGYRVLLADNGTDGLAFAREYHPALIVLDHSMPDRTGVEVARELKSDPMTADIPIVLMTAMSYGAVGMAALDAGCDAFLTKPVEPSRLLREIQARAPRSH